VYFILLQPVIIEVLTNIVYAG